MWATRMAHACRWVMGAPCGRARCMCCAWLCHNGNAGGEATSLGHMTTHHAAMIKPAGKALGKASAHGTACTADTRRPTVKKAKRPKE